MIPKSFANKSIFGLFSFLLINKGYNKKYKYSNEEIKLGFIAKFENLNIGKYDSFLLFLLKNSTLHI